MSLRRRNLAWEGRLKASQTRGVREMTSAHRGTGNCALLSWIRPNETHDCAFRVAGVVQSTADMFETSIVRDLGGARVLVVDDDADVLKLIEMFLTNANAVVVTASSAQDGLIKLDGFTPDVIVSDVDMPLVDGYGFIKQVRARPENGDVPAIALTAHGRDADRSRAITAGFDMHVRKPMRAIHLLTAIRDVLAKRAPSRSVA